MKEDFFRIFARFSPTEPPVGLFERVMRAIDREYELRRGRKLLWEFAALSVIFLIGMPFSWNILVSQTESSGITYFLFTAFSDLSVFAILWKNFSLAILESLPVAGIAIFVLNAILVLWAARLFLSRKNLLKQYRVKGAV